MKKPFVAWRNYFIWWRNHSYDEETILMMKKPFIAWRNYFIWWRNHSYGKETILMIKKPFLWWRNHFIWWRNHSYGKETILMMKKPHYMMKKPVYAESYCEETSMKLEKSLCGNRGTINKPWKVTGQKFAGKNLDLRKHSNCAKFGLE